MLCAFNLHVTKSEKHFFEYFSDYQCAVISKMVASSTKGKTSPWRRERDQRQLMLCLSSSITHAQRNSSDSCRKLLIRYTRHTNPSVSNRFTHFKDSPRPGQL